MSVLQTKRLSVVKRNSVLRFPVDADPREVLLMIDAWNARFDEHFAGVGYYNPDPELEMYSEGDEIVCCNAHYLYADQAFWREVSNSRTLTVDEPVVLQATA